ncbi:oxin biosynthesis protein [Nocardia ninae]|uniref:Methyltransferase domain-containing protein n=1 Tax=Nocardia ninae NBRC 108245 TaxID=1210091 RepID=A0A511MA21_9NOCA|nr:oxin biosynthesis protein [Nocardia ninae]GEM37439.1 hypothetical protein NN4_19580 [Nocardia ninae NBRC 108245]
MSNDELNYYTTPRSTPSGSETIFGIWERGDSFNDSVTPSTFVPEYRYHMMMKLLSLTSEGDAVFSIGCGNAAVEGALVERGRLVHAVDLFPEAVSLARAKGVDAHVADFFQTSAADVAGCSALYADGILGHLFDRHDGVGPAIDKLTDLDLNTGMQLVFSNDAPPDRNAPYAEHERVPGFWYVSKDYLAEELTDAGLSVSESYYFPYERPLSGLRNRSICVAHIR